jgi:predicted DCC family thiol-disulfide oxidoreductase YuxK
MAKSGDATAARPKEDKHAAAGGWQLKLFFDGLCPVCSWEMRQLKRRDTSGRLAFEDIAEPAFDPSRYGLTLDQTVRAMHAVTPDGRVLRGPDAFAAAYRLVGLHWLAALISFGPTRPLVDLGYRLFAWVRPRFSRFDPPPACSADRCAPARH